MPTLDDILENEKRGKEGERDLDRGRVGSLTPLDFRHSHKNPNEYRYLKTEKLAQALNRTRGKGHLSQEEIHELADALEATK